MNKLNYISKKQLLVSQFEDLVTYLTRDPDDEKVKMQILGRYNAAIENNPQKVCVNCQGTGVVEEEDYVDYGSTIVRMPQNFCCDTLMEGKCCKCGEEVDKETNVCPGCGHDWDDDD